MENPHVMQPLPNIAEAQRSLFTLFDEHSDPAFIGAEAEL